MMNDKLLLPNHWKRIGWWILVPTTLVGIFVSFTDFEVENLNATVFALINDSPLGKPEYFTTTHTNITSTIVGSLFIIGALLVAFSKERVEDELISKLRLSSLMWSVWVNYILLLIAFVFVYGLSFFTVMVYNMFTVLIIFIIRFNYILYRNSKIAADEK